MEIKTFYSLTDFVKKELKGDVRINFDPDDKSFFIVIELIFGFFRYHMSYSKNTRGQGYYFYEDWIYTEGEIVQMIYNDISKYI
jgi:hypothetical protein